MNQLPLLIFLFSALELFSQVDERQKITFQFNPSFEPSTEIHINFNKSIIKIDPGIEKTLNLPMTNDDKRLFGALIDSIENNLERPVVTMTIEGKEHVLENYYAEDGMMVYINFSNPDRREELGNIFSSTQSELLTKILNSLAERMNMKDYFNYLIKYLD